MTSDKTFGTAKNSVTYTEQMQVCLVAVENGSVHTLLLPNGTRTLPVASVLPEQSHEQALCQECLRTLGYDVEIDDYIGCADAYLTIDSRDLHLIRHYYSGQLVELIAEGDASVLHQQIALSKLQDAEKTAGQLEKMHLWAIEECVQMLRADAHGSEDEDL